jgi:hypothetical protein
MVRMSSTSKGGRCWGGGGDVAEVWEEDYREKYAAAYFSCFSIVLTLGQHCSCMNVQNV